MHPAPYNPLPHLPFIPSSLLPLTLAALGKQPDPRFGSGNFVPPYSYRFKFTKPGVYKYVCCIHAGLMKGTVVVK